MNLLIVGGSGFVGKSFIDGFGRGVLKKFKLKKIYIISRKPSVIKKTEGLNLNNIKLIKGDISNMRKLPNCKIIIYAAETTKISELKFRKKLLKIHIKSINNFCNLVKNKKNTKILYLSSGSIYGPQPNNIKKISEKYKCGFEYEISDYKYFYSKLKLYSESKILNLCKFGLKTSIARCFSFVGPWLPKNEHYAIGNFLLDGFNKQKIKVKSNFKVFRSYMYADDLIYWLLKIAINAKKKCCIYNVGSDEAVSLHALAKLIGKILKKPLKIGKIGSKKIDRYIPSIQKAKQELNLRINYNLKHSIYSTIKCNYEKYD